MTLNYIPHKKLNLLQVYRGIAALLVVLFHLTDVTKQRWNQQYFGNLFASGWSGVDYFFVLSGFIMIYVHGSLIGKRDKVKEFLVKRCVRIYPIYWIITVVVLIFFLIVPGFANPDDLEPLQIICSLLLIPYHGIPVLNVGWTLIYEIFFYLLFAVAIWLKPKYSLPILFPWLLITSLHFFEIINFRDISPFLQVIFGDMNLEFALGCLAGYCILKFPKIKQRWLLFAAANVAYITLALISYGILVDINRVSCFGLISAVLIVAAASIDLNDSIAIPSIFIYLGDASYSIFLLHGPFVSAITKIIAKANLTQFFDNLFAQSLLLLITVVVGCIFYSLVEKPLTILIRKNIVNKMTTPLPP
jgi:exopolysaccharide production protein ExoZ